MLYHGSFDGRPLTRSGDGSAMATLRFARFGPLVAFGGLWRCLALLLAAFESIRFQRTCFSRSGPLMLLALWHLESRLGWSLDPGPGFFSSPLECVRLSLRWWLLDCHHLDRAFG